MHAMNWCVPWSILLLPCITYLTAASPQANKVLVKVLCDVVDDLQLFGFCASFIHAPLYPHTVTDYFSTQKTTQNSEEVVRATVTTTLTSGTTDITNSVMETSTVSYTDATVYYETFVTITITSTEVITPSPILVTLGQPGKAKRALIPQQLTGYPESLISAACSSALATRTITLSEVATSTQIVVYTSTSTFVDNVLVPAATSFATVTLFTTLNVPVVETSTITGTADYLTTLTTTAPTPIVTVCPGTAEFTGLSYPNGIKVQPLGGVGLLDCCQSCLAAPGCSFWDVEPGNQCYNYIFSGAGPGDDSQCPSGTAYINVAGTTGLLTGGLGPCGTPAP